MMDPKAPLWTLILPGMEADLARLALAAEALGVTVSDAAALLSSFVQAAIDLMAEILGPVLDEIIDMADEIEAAEADAEDLDAVRPLGRRAVRLPTPPKPKPKAPPTARGPPGASGMLKTGKGMPDLRVRRFWCLYE